MESPFLAVASDDWVAANRSAFAIRDKFPVTDGHTLVVPRRLIRTWWEASADERHDMLELVEVVKNDLDGSYRPDGYNVGFNSGTAAGQTVDHLHIHVIPRYQGDVDDPRGGIRHVIPAKGNYISPSPQLAAEPALLDGREERLLKLELLRCLRNREFDRIDLVVSFIMKSGLEIVAGPLMDALERHANVRILTTDYMQITDADALARLLDMAELPGAELEAKVFHDPSTSFHPKAYLFWSSDGALAAGFVGSSNLSAAGVSTGVEWNVGMESVAPMLASFDQLWEDPRSLPLTHNWLKQYRQEWVPTAGEVVPIGIEVEPPAQPVEPRPIQAEALSALETTRSEGYHAGLVVMATGLGKTWLAAFDSTRPGFKKVLFVAHREEILRQSRDVFRQVRPDAELGLFYGDEKEADADVVFASIQTLARHLKRFDEDEFDYLVVDEFHHAAASSYRKVIDHFRPEFLLGLTATPERMDGADLLALCGDNIVFECHLVEGIRRDELCPFRYWGIKDVLDYEPIPWRNGRFDPEALTRAVETRDRAQQEFDEWQARKSTRTLAFCCSTTHADYMAEFFRERGVRAVAVHSAESSAPRRDSIEALRSGDLEVIFAVDVFNEGVDFPEVDTVLMLRPTESPVLFLQQLGRGLRTSKGKDELRVIDFIGNHRSFLLKPRALLSLGLSSTPADARVVEAVKSGEFDLPPGCSVTFEVEVVDMFTQLARLQGKSALEEYCISHVEDTGLRPTAVQAWRSGNDPTRVRQKHGGWFGLLDDLGLLSEMESAVVAANGDVLAGLEKESITKSYKLVTLRALLHDGALRTGEPVEDLVTTARAIMEGDPRLLEDVRGKEMPEPSGVPLARWVKFWTKWPLEHLASGKGGPGPWFRIRGDRFEPTFDVDPGFGDTFDALVAELVEYRLARYLLEESDDDTPTIRCRVGASDGRPLIGLDRQANPQLPEGEVEFVADGHAYLGNFVKIALNVARKPGEKGNALHSLLRGWFGPSAGHPGTNHRVEFSEHDGRWTLRPLDAAGDSETLTIPWFPSYEVACGAFDEPVAVQHEGTPIELSLPESEDISPVSHFVAIARGESMAGGTDPIHHGDMLLFEWVRGADRKDLEGKRVIVELTDGNQKSAALKTLARTADGWALGSASPDFSDVAGDSSIRIVARLVRRLDQAAYNPLARYIGDQFKRQQVSALYGQDYNPGNWNSGHVSIPGHAVLFVTLEKSEHMSWGSDYVDHFEDRDEFVWSSQASTGPDGKKGREILDALDTGTRVHLWARHKKTDVAFEYCGLMAPVSHHGKEPMSVRFRLLTAISEEQYRRLQPWRQPE